jgi:hypothetical protein
MGNTIMTDQFRFFSGSINRPESAQATATELYRVLSEGWSVVAEWVDGGTYYARLTRAPTRQPIPFDRLAHQ